MADRNELKERFNFTKQVIFEDLEKGYNVLALPDQIIIAGDADMYERELPGMLALAKLGEADPLLTTFIVESANRERDGKYCGRFAELCKPLQDAWLMKTLRHFTPDIYEKEIEGILKLKDISLSFRLMCYENPELRIEPAPGSNYIDALKQFCRMEPDVMLYLKLPEKAGEPFKAGIDGTRATRHFVVKEKTKKQEWIQ